MMQILNIEEDEGLYVKMGIYIIVESRFVGSA